MPAECERARARASLALDCELSPFERVALRTHLAECQACESFLVGVRELTHELRAAPLPAPSRTLVPPRRRGHLSIVLAVLAVVLAAGGGSIAGSLGSSQQPAPVTATGVRLAALFAGQPQHLPGTRLPLRVAV